MRRNLLPLWMLCVLVGCSPPSGTDEDAVIVTMPTRKDDSSACAYWKCSKEKKLYMQKYVKRDGTDYRPAGAYKLDQGIGAFPLEDLEKYGSDGSNVSLDNGFDPCPYCHSSSIGRCSCGKTLCIPNLTKTSSCSLSSNRVTCPWCSRVGNYSRTGAWNVGGGG